MTHEYVIALGGSISPRDAGQPAATALGWAADAILAVGSDEVVRAISRGDSTFLDLGGCVVTPLPPDAAGAEALVAGATDPNAELGFLLIDAGLLPPDARLEPGSPADLAMWGPATGPAGPGEAGARRLVAIVRGGHFTAGDAHRGPFPEADRP